MTEKFSPLTERTVQNPVHEIAPGDETERLFLEIAHEQNLLIEEAEMIQVKREKKRKGDKRTTVPDFLLKETLSDPGIYVEVTENSAQSGHKGRQRKVMIEAGLASRYVQLTGPEMEAIKNEGLVLLDYIKTKIKSRD